ncbi:hypothetical protein HS088_TW12G01117 [Tripterygium wilfordii]|uniref:TRF2/HOY1 PH-like domain-containing protein n=1 Tax=Tripterygium wilfordii TaxID=458696 RepID=A0A7J7D0L5_TRIWF|nr:uncharacterized protein LOC120011346 [Tripterygium wilfordii]KAF5739905.1 hypothetical protein HS088_TW12G01117 [Tripterygium wilfordii]
MLVQVTEDGEWVDNNGDDGGAVEFESDQITYLANKRLISIPAETQDEKVLTHNLLKLKPVGLNIGNASALQELLEKQFNQAKSSQNSKANRSTKQRVDDSTFLKNAEKMKATNFSAKLVKIGSWQIESRIEGDLVAKCYYAKKKLVWEYLDKSIKLKKKIEIQWSDISAIRAIIHNEHGILDIELNNPPTFHDEDDPQPRKHTCWKLTRDFTNGQGSIYRRHRLVFPPGCLDKHYEKLLSCDERLFELSHKSFPSSNSPYFRSNSSRQSSLFENNNAYGVDGMKHGSQFPFSYGFLPLLAPSQTPTYGQQPFQPFSASKETTTSPISVIEYQQIDESGTRFVNNKLMTYFDPQRTRSYGNDLPQNLQTLMYQANNQVAYHQSLNTTSTLNSQSELLALDSLEDHLLSNSLAMDNNESNFLPKVDSLNELLHDHVVPKQFEISNFEWSEQPLYQQQVHYPSQISNEGRFDNATFDE